MSNQNLFEKRHGRFTISRQLINEVPSIVQEILSTVIVLRAEYMLDRDCIEYSGLSHSFKPVTAGYQGGWYTPVSENGHFLYWEPNE